MFKFIAVALGIMGGTYYGFTQWQTYQIAQPLAMFLGGMGGGLISSVIVSMPAIFRRTSAVAQTNGFWIGLLIPFFVGVLVVNIVITLGVVLVLATHPANEILPAVKSLIHFTPAVQHAVLNILVYYVSMGGCLALLFALVMIASGPEETSTISTSSDREEWWLFPLLLALAFLPTAVPTMILGFLAVIVFGILRVFELLAQVIEGIFHAIVGVHTNFFAFAFVYGFLGGASGTWFAIQFSLGNINLGAATLPAPLVGGLGGIVFAWILGFFLRSLLVPSVTSSGEVRAGH